VATGTIKHKRDSLIGKTAVCWLNGNSHDTEPQHVAEALEEKLRIGHHEIKVVKHFLEQYLIFFNDSRDYQRVLHHHEVPTGAGCTTSNPGTSGGGQ
jgi:hypothetical protein